MTVRFQADADLNTEIVAGVLRREPSIDFQTADEASLHRVPDPEVLVLAAQENRILVTHDSRTMPRHFAEFIRHHSSPGVFLIAQTVSVRAAIEELLLGRTSRVPCGPSQGFCSAGYPSPTLS
jgi:predicted nuclease of predicted toxin-antitoxin system